MNKIPEEAIKSRLKYKCMSCGGEELIVDEKRSEWIMIGSPPYAVSPPMTDFASGGVRHEVPPMVIWHECHVEPDRPPVGYGMCQFVGLVPIQEKDNETEEANER